MPETVHEQVVKWRVDTSTANTAQRSVDQLARRYAELKIEMSRLQGEARDAAKAFRSQTGDINAIAQKTLALKKTTQDLRDTEKELKSALSASNAEYAERESLAKQMAADRRQRENLGADARLYGDVESRTRAITGAIGYYGGEGIERGVNFGSEVLASVEAVKLLKLELPDLVANLGLSATALGALGAAALVTVGAFQKAKEIIKDSGEVTRSYLKNQEEYFELIATGTESELRAAIDEKKRTLELTRARLDEIKYIQDQAEATGGLAGAILKLDDAFNTNLGGSRDLEKAGNDLGGEIFELERQVRFLEKALSENATASADYRVQLEQQARAQLEVAAILATATPDAYNAQMKALQDSAAVLRAQIGVQNEYAESGEAASVALTNAMQQIETLRAEMPQTLMPTPEERQLQSAARLAAQEQRDLIEANQAVWKAQIEQGSLAEQALAELENELAVVETQIQALEAVADDVGLVSGIVSGLDNASRIYSEINTLSKKQAEDELARTEFLLGATQDAIDALEGLGVENNLIAASVTTLTQQYADLQARQVELTDTLLPAIEAREAEIERVKELTDLTLATGKALESMGKSIFFLNQQGVEDRKGTRFGDVGKVIQEERDAADKRLEAVREFAEDAAQLEEDRFIKLSQDAEDAERQRTQDIADHYTDLAKLDAQYYQNRATLLADLAEIATEAEQERVKALQAANKEAERAAEDHQDRIQNILRNARRDEQSAASRGDAVALRQAQLRAQDALEDEQDQYDKEKDRREEDFADRLQELDEQRRENLRAGQQRLEDLRRQHDQERNERIADFNLKISREDQQRAIELQREESAWNLENNRRMQSLLDQQNMTSATFLQLYNIVDGGWTSIENRFAVGMAALGALAPSGVGGALAGLGGFPSFDYGGEMTRTGLAHLKQGEWVMVPEVAQAARRFVGGQLTQQSLIAAMQGAGTSLSIPVNIQAPGLSGREIARLETLIPARIEAVMTELFQELG